MPIARNVGEAFVPCPEGTHIARCIGCISLGTQPQNNPQFAPAFKIMLVWELPDELLPSGDAMTVSKELTCSLAEKANLRHLLESWRGRQFTALELQGFDVASVVDAPCMLTVIHKKSAKGSVYADVSTAAKLPKGVQPKERFNELVRYEIEQGADAVYASLPQWVQKKIALAAEWIAQPTKPAPRSQEPRTPEPQPDEPPAGWGNDEPQAPDGDDSSDIPF
jgi:hypothetical protein